MIPGWAPAALSAALFALGVLGFFVKRDLLSQFLSVEVMLAGAALAFLALSRSAAPLEGQVLVLFVITVAAAEAAVGLAVVLLVFRRRKSVRGADLRDLKG